MSFYSSSKPSWAPAFPLAQESKIKFPDARVFVEACITRAGFSAKSSIGESNPI